MISDTGSGQKDIQFIEVTNCQSIELPQLARSNK